MLKQCLITFAVSLWVPVVALFAQEGAGQAKKRPLYNINFNAFGDATLFSQNFEKLFFVQPKFFFTGRVGVGYNEEFSFCIWGPCGGGSEQFLALPHHFTANFGGKRSFLEVGAGGTYLIGPFNNYYYAYPILGYRLHPMKPARPYFRSYVCYPYFGKDNKYIILLPIGLNFGFSF